MKSLALLPWLLALAPLAACSATMPSTTEPETTAKPLPYADCIDVNRINGWYIVDDRRAIVQTGPKHYLVTLKADCPQLRHPPGLIFTAGAMHTGSGRICGAVGESVHSRGQPSCAIDAVTPIDQARYDELAGQVMLHRTPPPAMPATQPLK